MVCKFILKSKQKLNSPARWLVVVESSRIKPYISVVRTGVQLLIFFFSVCLNALNMFFMYTSNRL